MNLVKTKKWRKLYIIILGMSTLCVWYFVYHMKMIETTSSYFLYPLLRVQKSFVMPIKEWYQNRKSKEQLQQVVDQMNSAHQQVLAENIALRAEKNYAEDMSELHEYRKRFYDDNGVIAQILTRHLSERAHYILVDAGMRQQIKKDMVAVYKNNLVGRVVEVYPWYCKVQLITDKNCKIAAFCAETKTPGIHEGANSQITFLNYVNHLKPVKEGDMILSSGEGLIFPHGFALGRIAQCKRENLYYEIEIQPLYTVRDIRYCVLIDRETVS